MSPENDRSDQRALSIITILFVACGMGFLALILSPESAPKPALLRLALALSHGSKVPNYNLGYVLFSSLALRVGGIPGIFWAQALEYGCIGLGAFFLLRKARVDAKATLLAAVAVIAHPILWLNVHRIVDTNLTVFCVLFFLLGCLPRKTPHFSWIQAVAFGIFCGFMVLGRPNLLLILPMIFAESRFRAKRALLIFIAGILTYASLALVATGEAFPPPAERAWVLFQGANPWSGSFLIRDLNAEQSGYPAARNIGVTIPRGPQNTEVPSEFYLSTHPDLGLQEKLTDAAWSFIREHPLKFSELAVLKAFTLLRPDSRSSARESGWKHDLFWCMQILLALIFPFWMATKVLKRDTFLGPIYAAPLALLYIIPLMLTDSDPRLRLPLDLIFAIETFVLLLGSHPRADVPGRPPELDRDRDPIHV